MKSGARDCGHQRLCACDEALIVEAIRATAAEEREACAVIAEEYTPVGYLLDCCEGIADEIRARGTEASGT